MKFYKSVITGIIILLVFCLFSCASTPENKIDSVYVMVYDYENSEIMNVKIFMDNKEIGQTDVYGRLTFFCDKEQEVMVRAEKNGYEIAETKMAIKPGFVLYVKMGTGSYYAEMAEQFLDENDLQNANKMISKALKIEERKDWVFLRDVILKKGKKDE